MAPNLVAKRTACDRCRIQKLRCPPSTDGSKACLRCTRLGAQCMTSYPRPPNTSLQMPPQELPELRPKIVGGLPTPASTIMSAQLVTQANEAPLGPTNTTSMHQSNDSISNTPFEPISFSLDDNFDYFANVPMEIMGEDATTGMFFNDAQSYQSPSPSGTNGSNSSPEHVDLSQIVQPRASNLIPVAHKDFSTQYSIRLAKLNFDLSSRVVQCLEASSDQAPVVGDMRESKNGDTSKTEVLFEQALNDLSEFVTIIRAYTTRMHGMSTSTSTKAVEQMTSGSHPEQRISIVIFLNLLSAYLQIIVIYDNVLRHLCFKLFGSPAETCNTNMPTAAGDARMTGLMGPLRTKILVHAILHQFDDIERMLGLPADLRVTEKQSTYSGLFEDDRARGLLGAVSNGNRIEDVWGQAGGNESRTSKALCGLRESLKLVQSHIDD